MEHDSIHEDGVPLVPKRLEDVQLCQPHSTALRDAACSGPLPVRSLSGRKWFESSSGVYADPSGRLRTRPPSRTPARNTERLGLPGGASAHSNARQTGSARRTDTWLCPDRRLMLEPPLSAQVAPTGASPNSCLLASLSSQPLAGRSNRRQGVSDKRVECLRVSQSGH